MFKLAREGVFRKIKTIRSATARNSTNSVYPAAFLMQDRVLLAHGGGGLLSSEIIRTMILPRFANPALNRLDDSAIFDSPGSRLAFTTDSFVVSPVFFPGGNIGDLAVCGTVNDLAMAGAAPKYLSLSLILEEGLPFADLEKILDSARARAEEAGVQVACGDTKVVPKGQADGIYINTAGIGAVSPGADVSSHNAKPGDAILISGPPGLHGLAVMLARGNLGLATPIISDVAPLNRPVAALLENKISVRVLRDLTRGGLAMALNDIAENSGVTLEIREAELPSTPPQISACDILGLDILNVASEGCFVSVVGGESAAAALDIIRGFPVGNRAAVVGSVRARGRYPVELVTPVGSRRIVFPPRGELLPRIC